MSRFDEMSIAERILYVEDLWDRIAEELEGVPVSEEWKAEFARRVDAHRADPRIPSPISLQNGG